MSIESFITQLHTQRRQVDFDTYDVLVEQLVSMVESQSINIAPAYQRKFRWDNARRSELIESVFLGVPVPSLFMATNLDGTWEVVDGVQRISTIVQFAGTKEAREQLNLADPLKIDKLRKLSDLNGLLFERLPESIKLQFRHRPIKVITLSDKSDRVVRFDLFERLNSGGIALTNQEIRSCIFRGEFNQFLEELAKENHDFRGSVRLNKRQENDGTREECALRFFSFLNRYRNFEHSVVDFLNDYMRSASSSFNYRRQRSLFVRTFRQLIQVLPNGIVRGRRRTTTPINLFEAVAVGAALALKERPQIDRTNIHGWIGSPDLKRLTTGATNSRDMVVGRIEFCRDRFLGK